MLARFLGWASLYGVYLAILLNTNEDLTFILMLLVLVISQMLMMTEQL